MSMNRVGNLMLAALCVLTLLVLVIGSVRGAQANLRNDHVVRCEEDMPCWDCSTMGNLNCGTVQR